MAKPVWKGKTWLVNAADASHKPLLKKPVPAKFKLLPNRKERPRYYRVSFKKGAMSAIWKRCILFERGKDPAPKLNTFPPNPQESDYLAAGDEIRPQFEDARYQTVRLEGDVRLPGGVVASVNLVQIPVKGQKPLLMMFLIDDVHDPDGSAVGRPQ